MLNEKTDNKKTGKGPKGVVTVQLHGLRLLDDCQQLIDKVLTTFNSASRCSFKHFQDIGLNDLLKSHKTPNKRKFMARFRNTPMVDGRPVCYECPPGMSESEWRKMREEAYRKKALDAWNNASPFWQIDKDLGSPISGTEKLVGEWVKKNGYELDTMLLHNAVLAGFRNYKSFERQKSKWRTDKETPCFGDIEARSKKRISHEEWELSRNASLTVIGRKKVGNPKFKFNLDDCEMDFTYQRKKIRFSFKSHRFSKKGLKHLAKVLDAMERGELAVTVTLTKLAEGRFDVSLSYSPSELSTRQTSNVVTGIWFSDEVVHHQISKGGRILHERTYKVEDFTRERKTRKLIQDLKYSREYETLKSVQKKVRNRAVNGTRDILNKIFRTSHAYGSTTVVVETPSSKSKRNFNNGYIGFDKYKVAHGTGANCFIAASRFLKMVQSQCAKNGMALKKVNGAFIQLNAVLASSTMSEAIRKATSEMVARAEGQNIDLTYSAERVLKSSPSMLDWVGHLLHNKRGRQARGEVKRAFQSRTVEKAVRLLDKGQKRSTVQTLV